ncbi:hypothetical protein M9H77_26794 [Catharanthus roseus]|uniref:Uncharacterized protein n=1 Tax=Catharanthus roseus TaxID=4058 RepID=A0ACC0AB58_CATRO|nr:hypothetical protein M9H77_26794 [Catharanthus roseus]
MVAQESLPLTVGHRTTSDRHIGDKGSPDRRLQLTCLDYANRGLGGELGQFSMTNFPQCSPLIRNQGSKQRIRASVEQLERQAQRRMNFLHPQLVLVTQKEPKYVRQSYGCHSFCLKLHFRDLLSIRCRDHAPLFLLHCYRNRRKKITSLYLATNL